MEVTLPHQFSPRPYQLPLLRALDSGASRAAVVWHRRSGKDKVCFNYMVKRAFERVGTYFYFLPTYTQARKVIWENIDNDGFRMLDHIPKALIKSKNEQTLKIELVNGSIVQLVAADEFKESGVGTNPVGVVFSEYSVTAPDAWQFVAPILAANGGWAIFNFTPRGKNHAWELLQRARDNPRWYTQLLTVDDTGVFTEEALDEERRNNPEAIFKQEYYCVFTENAGQFFRRIGQNTYPEHREPDLSHNWHLGVDLAKYQDYTVLTPFDLNTFVVHAQDRFNQVDWALQKARIEAEARRLNNARVKIDRTGVGDPVVEDLIGRGLNISEDDAIVFTEQRRRNLLDHLSMLLEQDKIKMPADDGLISELESFQYTLTPQGRIKVAVPEGMHDDRVMSLALAVDGVNDPLGVMRPERFPRSETGLYSATYD